MDNSFVDAVQKQPKWRLLVSQVYLGNCYLEKEMHFKDFAQSGEIRVLELLKYVIYLLKIPLITCQGWIYFNLF